MMETSGEHGVKPMEKQVEHDGRSVENDGRSVENDGKSWKMMEHDGK